MSHTKKGKLKTQERSKLRFPREACSREFSASPLGLPCLSSAPSAEQYYRQYTWAGFTHLRHLLLRHYIFTAVLLPCIIVYLIIVKVIHAHGWESVKSHKVTKSFPNSNCLEMLHLTSGNASKVAHTHTHTHLHRYIYKSINWVILLYVKCGTLYSLLHAILHIFSHTISISWVHRVWLLLTVSSCTCTPTSLADAPILDTFIFSLRSFISTLSFRIARIFSLVCTFLSNKGKLLSNFTFTKVTEESNSRQASHVWFFRPDHWQLSGFAWQIP